MRFDTIVLGGGIVGVSVAVHLQQRGLSVALVDLKQPGNETSFGNGGLIQREGVYPYAFPRGLGKLLHYATNRSPDVRYHRNAMFELAPFLWSYWRNSHPAKHAAISRSYATLIEHCVTEHETLAQEAGVSALLCPTGWMKIFRSHQKQDEETRAAEQWRREFDVKFESLDSAQLRAVEPDLDTSLLGALHYPASVFVSDPGALVTGYANYFEKIGGRFFLGDARTLRDSWRVDTGVGQIEAASAVVATGPWSDQVIAQMGYRLPLAIKRGYHMHYGAQSNARLNHPVLDVESGYLLAPMSRGIRLTTGIEFARADAPKTPEQLDVVEPTARSLFPLGKRIDAEPWMGRRPCTPDMLPIIGPAMRHKNLWFAFGHAHHGLTLGPITGRLVAEMMTGRDTLVDSHPFRVDRFQ